MQLAAARRASSQLSRYLTVAATHYAVPRIGGAEAVRLPPLTLTLTSTSTLTPTPTPIPTPIPTPTPTR